MTEYLKFQVQESLQAMYTSILTSYHGTIKNTPPLFFQEDYTLTVIGNWNSVIQNYLAYEETTTGGSFQTNGEADVWNAIGDKLHNGDPAMTFQLHNGNGEYTVVTSWYEFFDSALSRALDETQTTGGVLNGLYLQSELNKWNDRDSIHTLSPLTLSMSNTMPNPSSVLLPIDSNTYFWAGLIRAMIDARGEASTLTLIPPMTTAEFNMLKLQSMIANGMYHGPATVVPHTITLQQNDTLYIPINFHDGNHTNNIHGYIILKQS